MDSEKLIFQIVAYKTKTQTGDAADYLRGHVIDDMMYHTLKQRDKTETGNPIDLKETFFKQNPN